MIWVDLPPGVALGSYTAEKIKNLWDILRKYPSTFADGTKNVENFVERILAGDSIVLELDGGIILVENIREGHSAEFHATFWDHKLSARTGTLKQCIYWLFLVFQLERLETFVADYARAVRRFLTGKLGFQHEGTLRNAFRNNGELHNLDVYSIIKSEVL